MSGPFTFSPEERGFTRVDEDSDALYAADTSRDATGKVDRVEFAARGSEATGFYAQKIKRDESGQIVGKQTFGTKSDTRQEAVESIESQVRNRTAAKFGGLTIGEFNVGRERNIDTARRAHLSRTQEAKTADASKRAPITTDASRYASQPGELDYPGVDTPTTDPQVLPKDLRQKQRPNTTDPDTADVTPTVSVEETPSTERNTTAPDPFTLDLGQRDVSLAPEEAFEGVASGSYDGFSGVGSRTDEQRRLESGSPPQQALQEQQQSPSGGGVVGSLVEGEPFDEFDEDAADELADTFQSLRDRGLEVEPEDVADEARSQQDMADEFGIPQKDPVGLGIDTANRFIDGKTEAVDTGKENRRVSND